jgi:Uncharacterized protein conserved in bacteria
MRTPTGAGRWIARWRWALLCTAVFAVTGCATLRATVAGYATGPNGIARSQQRLRQALIDADYAKALAWHEDDALLQALTTGAAAYYAKQFSRSAAVLDTAALLADDRITASLSRDGLAFVTNDMARRYQPRRTERLFIPYYAMLSYVQLGAWEDAAVEGRRLVTLLDQFGEDRDAGERALHGAMQHLAGAVFERAGERDAAQVAYRAAHALSEAFPESLSRGTIADEGELLIVVERGFVAHRATETLELQLDDDDRDSLGGDDEHRRRAAARIVADAGISGRRGNASASAVTSTLGLPTYAPSHRRHDDDDDYHLTVAFPSLRRSARPWGGDLRLAVDGTTVDGMAASAVIDDASEVDARRERVALTTRAVARAATKYAVTKAIKDKKGEVAGQIANLGASLLERADVRSWHLLPQAITLARVRVPAGARAVRIDVGEGTSVRTVDVGTASVRAGALTIVPVRLWRDPPPRPPIAPAPVVAEADAGCLMLFCQ